MKRRNAELGKMRRPVKRNKITEGVYASVVLYTKFVALYALVILADYLLEFRFEFLWPFYMCLKSVYDSFKAQGLAFSVFIACIALTSDMLCFFFIPVNWLFFAASTFVWVQYIWNTDRSVCAPTVFLWVVFVYLEAAVRLRDVKNMTSHMDFCRPFAAHCIGYPVVTLGFGFKTYVGFRMRQRKQRVVARENEFYMQLLQQALPVEEVVANGSAQVEAPTQPQEAQQAERTPGKHHQKNGQVMNGTIVNGVQGGKAHHRKSVEKSKEAHVGGSSTENDHNTPNSTNSRHNSDKHIDRQRVNHSHLNGSAFVEKSTTTPTAAPVTLQTDNEAKAAKRREKKEQEKEREAAEYLQRLELDLKRLRVDLQGSRQSEQELRLQVAALTTSEKVSKGELSDMQRELEDLQSRLQSASSMRSSDRQTISNLERRVADERRLRSNCEAQLAQERKTRKQELERAAQVAAAQSSRGECTDSCKARRRELEAELSELRQAKHWSDEQCAALERENSQLIEQLRESELLMQTLAAMQEKNDHLESSLSAETRIKLDLFSALGEAKRQLEIRESCNRAQEKEIDELKTKIAQVLAVMPNDAFGGPTPSNSVSRVRLAESPPGSTLDPNATAYTPKGSLVTSTEA